jgi:hypothetical protein
VTVFGHAIAPLASEPAATIRQLLHQKVYDDAGYIRPTWNLDPGVASFIRVAIAVAAIPAALILIGQLAVLAWLAWPQGPLQPE